MITAAAVLEDTQKLMATCVQPASIDLRKCILIDSSSLLDCYPLLRQCELSLEICKVAGGQSGCFTLTYRSSCQCVVVYRF